MEQIIPNTIAVLNWMSVNIPWELVIASGILSPVVLLFKKWLHLQSEKVMMSLVLILSTLGAAASYILGSASTDPSVIATQSLMVAAMSQPYYYVIVKPLSLWFSGELAKARAFDAEVKSAAIPATGLPVSNQQ